MKKTLFALLACATLAAPAMAANWTLAYADYGWYNRDDNYSNYTFYLYQDPAADITTVTGKIAEMTRDEFTAAAGTGFAFTSFEDGEIYAGDDFATTISKDTPSNEIWGVCVYNGENAVFSVCAAENNSWVLSNFGLCYYTPDNSYTAFNPGSPATPEPATATLSLLALAGLCARRRRH